MVGLGVVGREWVLIEEKAFPARSQRGGQPAREVKQLMGVGAA